MSLKKSTNKKEVIARAISLLLVFTFISSAMTGLLIAFYFIPAPDKAALSLNHIQENVFAGATIIKIHRLCSVLTPVLILFILVSMTALKAASDARVKAWQCAVTLLSLFVCFKITGYLLCGNNSSAHLLKAFLDKIPGPKSASSSAPAFFDILSIPFVRVYVLHGIILPVVTAPVLIVYQKNMRELFGTLKPAVFHPVTLWALFFTLLTATAFFLKPLESPISSYAENYFDRFPYIIKMFISMNRIMSFSISVVISLSVYILLVFGPIILRKLKK